MELLNELLSVKNIETIKFYNENPNINFEDVNAVIVHILQMAIKSTNDTTSNVYTHQPYIQNVKTVKSVKNNKNDVELILSKINPTANMVKNTTNDLFYDFMVTTENKHKILIANKETNLNIQNEEVEIFLNSCAHLNSNGIFISHNSGIINKNNYHIDKIGKNIVVYIHFADFNLDKIKIAFDIINNIVMNMADYHSNTEVDSIDILNEINKEHHVFTKQKNELKNNIKENTNKLLNQLDDMKMSKLNTYLASKCLSVEPVGLYKCDLCNFYTANKLKAMAAHKRGCKKKTHTMIS